MKISDIGEFGLIDRIRRSARRHTSRVPIGIGDDAAVLRSLTGKELLVTTDMLLEGVHFDLATTDMRSLGWKSAAVNLSDIAAMGGVPRYCLVALAIPRRVTVEDITAFYRGLNSLLREHRVQLVGGDTCSSNRDLMVSITVLGEAEPGRFLTRRGARPGDLVFVTGTLGDSAAGLELLRKAESGMRNTRAGKASEIRAAMDALVERHLRPVPRVAWGRKLAVSGLVNSMIDISDGLSSDLAHICEESGCGADIFEDRLPLSRELRAAKAFRRPLIEYALAGGEDYELLFTAPAKHERPIRALRTGATVVGEITRRKGMRLIGPAGKAAPLEPRGHDHFRSGRPGRGSAR